MTLPQRFHVVVMTAVTCLSAPLVGAQGLQPVQVQQPGADSNAPRGMRHGDRMRLFEAPSGSTAAVVGQTSPAAQLMSGVAAAQPEAAAAPRSEAHSMLDEPATPAQIQISGDRLSINATNASLSEVIREVAKDTGMQVEGNSRDERVFGSYGPGSPPEVLSALLYDSGYNVIMVGSTADGAPRRLVLSARGADSTQAAVTPARNSDDEDEEPPAQEVAPAPPPNPIAAPGVPPASGQPKTPQQMLEELQRMHQGQQAPELPHD